MRSTIFYVLVLTLLAGFTTALAQPRPDSNIAVSRGTVIITATRNPETLDHLPMAGSYVPSSLYSTGRGYELKDALWSVPGVLTQARSGHTDLRITIRGFGARGAANRSNAGNMRGIRLLMDGIPETEPDGRTSLDLVNLDATNHIEVLRSNASSLYGSASGGVINLSTNLDFKEPFVEVKNTFGSFGFLRNSATAGGVVGRTNILASFANTTFGDSAWRTYRVHGGGTQMLASLGILSRIDNATTLGVYLGATSNLFRFPGPLTRAQLDSAPEQANSGFVARDERRFNRQGRLAVTMDHQFSTNQEVSASVWLQPKMLERSERNTYRDFLRYGIGSQARYTWHWKVDSSTTSRFSAGFDQQYQDGAILFYSLAPGGARGDTLQQNKQEGATTVGGFVEEMITLGDRWSLRLGLRADRIRYFFRNFIDPEPGNVPQEKTFSHLTPKGSLSYRFIDGHTLFASVGGGVEAPAYNEVDPPSDSLVVARGGEIDPKNKDFNPLLDPTTSTSFEIGARGFVPMDGFITFLGYDVAGYLIRIKNDLVPWNGGRFYFTAADTRRTGVEIGLSAETSIGLSLRGQVTIGTSEYLEYENNFGRFDGNSTAGLPTTFSSIRLRYDAPFGLFIEPSVDYVGEYFADDRNDRKTDGTPDPTVDSRVDAYSLIGLTAGWDGEIGPIGLSLYAGVHNLADTQYAGSVFINGENNQYFEPGMPRNFVVGLAIRYK